MDPIPSFAVNLLAGALPAVLGVMSYYLDQIYLLLYKVNHYMPGWASVLERLWVAMQPTPPGSSSA